MFDATDGGPAVAEMAGITGGSFVLNGVTWHHENDFEKLRRELSEWAQKVSYALGGRPGEFNLTPDQADRQIRELTTERDTWMRDALAHYGSMLSMQDELAEAKAPSNGLTVNPRLVESFVADGVRWIREADDSPSLPEPDVNNPEQCRFVSEVSRRLEPEVADGYADWERGLTAREWGQRADRLEREQAAKTAQDHAIEQAAQVMYEGYNRGSDWAKASAASHDLYRRYARDLADAGLLNTKHGEAAADIPTPSLGEIFDFNSVPDKYCGCDKWMISEPCGHAGGEA